MAFVDPNPQAFRDPLTELTLIMLTIMRQLVEAWDHAFLVYQDDARVRAFLETMPEHKTVIINGTATAENLAAIAFERLAGVYDAHYGVNLRLAKVRLYETP